jgi:tRNA threonylcarbamoyladenosine biosynthesis protein TsaE
MHKNYLIKTDAAMQQLGAQLSNICGDNCVLYLEGELGAGKTTLTRGFLRALGYKGKVKSPTYNIVEHYTVDSRDIYHFDFYRLVNSSELEDLGIRDYFAKKAIFLIEWPERGIGLLPPADIKCKVVVTNTRNERNVEIIQTK